MSESTELERQHEPNEAVGGYIECSCGWPTKEQFADAEPYIRHVMAKVLELHQDSYGTCEHCMEEHWYVEFPCPTVRAARGEEG